MASINIEEILAFRDDAGTLRAIVVTGIALNHKAEIVVRIQCGDETKSVKKLIPNTSIDFSKSNPSWTVTFEGDDLRECNCGGIIKALAKIEIIDDESGQIVDAISDDKTQHIVCDSLDNEEQTEPLKESTRQCSKPINIVTNITNGCGKDKFGTGNLVKFLIEIIRSQPSADERYVFRFGDGTEQSGLLDHLPQEIIHRYESRPSDEPEFIIYLDHCLESFKVDVENFNDFVECEKPDLDDRIKEFDLCSFFLGLAVYATLSTIILLIVAGCSVNPIVFGIGVTTGTAAIGFTSWWIYFCKDSYRIPRLIMLSIILMILLSIKTLAFSVISHQCISGSISSIVFIFLIVLALYFGGNLVDCCQLPVITFEYFSNKDKKNILWLFIVALIFGVVVGVSSLNPVFGLIVFLAVFFGGLAVIILNKEFEIF